MPPTRLQREGSSLEELRSSIRAEFGPAARIVAAEKVTTGGIGGLFRKHHFEATVELPTPGDEPVARVAITADAPRRAGIDWAVLHNQSEEGGFKGSGQGRMRGLAVMDDFVELKHVAFAFGSR